MCLTSSAGHSTWMFALEANRPCSNVQRDITFNFYSIQDSSLTASLWRFKTKFFYLFCESFHLDYRFGGWWTIGEMYINHHYLHEPHLHLRQQPGFKFQEIKCNALHFFVWSFNLDFQFGSWSNSLEIYFPLHSIQQQLHLKTAARPPASKGQLQCDFKPGIESWLTFSSTLF